MAGLDRNTPQPTALTVHQASRALEVSFDDGAAFRIPFELMRIYSPSAEVQGHGPGQEVLQTGKRDVGIDNITAVGHYAVQHASATVTTPASSRGTTSTAWAATRRRCGSSTKNDCRPRASTATRR